MISWATSSNSTLSRSRTSFLNSLNLSPKGETRTKIHFLLLFQFTYFLFQRLSYRDISKSTVCFSGHNKRVNSSDKFVRRENRTKVALREGEQPGFFYTPFWLSFVKESQMCSWVYSLKKIVIWRLHVLLKDRKQQSGNAAEVTHTVAKENINRQTRNRVLQLNH